MAERTVQEIPLNGRHFVDLGPLMPGGVTPPQNAGLSAPLRGQGSFSFMSAGNRETSVNFMVNGINLNDLSNSQVTFQPSINTVSEFKVDNSTFSAEYGRNSGAIVNVATRSGANALHGEAFDFYRDDKFDSRNYFNPEPNPKSLVQPQAVRRQPRRTDREEQDVLLLQLRRAAAPAGRRPERRACSPTRSARRSPIRWRGGCCSTSRPATPPTPAGSRGCWRRASRRSTSTSPRSTSGTRSAKNDDLHGYYAFQKDLRQEPNAQGNTVPGFGDTRGGQRQIMTLNETHIFSQALVNEARAGFNRINISFNPLPSSTRRTSASATASTFRSRCRRSASPRSG